MKPKLEANNTNSSVSISIKTALVRNFYFCSTYFLYTFTFMIQTNLEALFEVSQAEANPVDLTLSLLSVTPQLTILYCNSILRK